MRRKTPAKSDPASGNLTIKCRTKAVSECNVLRASSRIVYEQFVIALCDRRTQSDVRGLLYNVHHKIIKYKIYISYNFMVVQVWPMNGMVERWRDECVTMCIFCS